MAKLTKNRTSEMLDVIKGVAIITVVIGHAIQFGSGEEYLLKNSFFIIIYLSLYIVFIYLFLC